MLANIYAILLFSIPVILIILFGVSLYRYVSAKNRNRTVPGTFTDDEIKKRKNMLIVLSAAVGVLVAVVIGFTVLLCIGVAYM